MVGGGAGGGGEVAGGGGEVAGGVLTYGAIVGCWGGGGKFMELLCARAASWEVIGGFQYT